METLLLDHLLPLHQVVTTNQGLNFGISQVENVLIQVHELAESDHVFSLDHFQTHFLNLTLNKFQVMSPFILGIEDEVDYVFDIWGTSLHQLDYFIKYVLEGLFGTLDLEVKEEVEGLSIDFSIHEYLVEISLCVDFLGENV